MLRHAGLKGTEYGDAARSGSRLDDSLPGIPGTGVDALFSLLPYHIAANPQLVGHVLMNWGVNDMEGWPLDEATWKMNYLTIIDWAHARWPLAKIAISYPWRVGYDAPAAVMHEWIDDMMNQRYFLFPGVDEAVTIKGNDNGWSETDAPIGAGVHYSALGVQLYADAMKSILLSA